MKLPVQISARQTLVMALGAVWAHKFRSGLTILGIVIGITTVVTVASLLTGLRQGIVDFFQEFGPDNIFIARVSGDPSGQQARPKERKRKPLRPEYADYLRSVVRSTADVGVSLYIIPQGGNVLSVKVPGYESDNLFVAGASRNLYDISPRDVQQGRLFTREEELRGQRVCLVGSALGEALFPAGNGVGRSIWLDGGEFTVVGIFAPAKGGFFGENGLDRQIVIPLATARIRYPQADNFFLTAQARHGQREEAIEEIRAALRKLRHTPRKEEDDFTISTADSIIENFDKITGMIVLISMAISALGLLVGGIGVMNIMLVSVTERTREIGVRKAIGARRRDIVLQFLSEAVALTGAGGMIGIVFSIVVTLLIGAIFPSLRCKVPSWAVATAFSVSVVVGLFFGVWPAVTAARLDPVEALRYE
ncbi:MAG TPA: ABC transporter permease [Bryobacteraceae bacterium]|nr:ABC transporter permease [Bryobacteraceae bacterium]